MKDFFKSWRFKVLLVIMLLMLGFMLYAASRPELSTLTANFLSAITSPFQKLSSNISGAASGFFDKILNSDKIYNENQALKEEIRRLNEMLVDFDRYKAENEQYKDFLHVKEENPDFTFAPATVIGRDPNDRFGSFTIDKGLLDGVELYDPVITADGLVGRVYQVGSISCKVMTILDPQINVGSFVSSTRDTGVASGELTLSLEGRLKLLYLSRDTKASPGDLVVTSGTGGVFPRNLIIGNILQVLPETHGNSYYAVIEPKVDVSSVTEVFVITSFRGQGSGSDMTDTPPSSQAPSSSSTPPESSAPASGQTPQTSSLPPEQVSSGAPTGQSPATR